MATVRQLNIIERHISQDTVLPRLHFLLEPILMDDVERDDLFSIRDSLIDKELEGKGKDHFMVWGLRHTANVERYIQGLVPTPLPVDWMPANARLILRLLLVKLDMNEHFRNASFYENFICFVVAAFPDLGLPDKYVHTDHTSRMDLFRYLEEQKIITTSDISPLISILSSLELKNLQEKLEEDFDKLLKDASNDTFVAKQFSYAMSKLPQERVLPRISYMLEYLLTDDVNKDDLLSIYKSLKRRDTRGFGVQYIIWALRNTGNEKIAEDYLKPLLVQSYPIDWMPPDPRMVMRMVLVHMDMSEQFKDKKSYQNFIRSMSQHDELIGIPNAYPHDKYNKRMELYKRLEEVKLVAPASISKLLEGLRDIGMHVLLDQVEKEFLSLVFSKNKVSPITYYSEHQLAHCDKDSPLYSMHRLDVPHTLPPVTHISPSVTPPPKYEESLPHHTAASSAVNRTTPSGSSIYQKPPLEERIWIESESGADVVNLCIEKIQATGIFPKDTHNQFMRRIAYTMTRDGNPTFPLATDGGIWQVSLYAFTDTMNTRAHVRLTTKYEKIASHFGINWLDVKRVDLAVPMYSALAARLYLSNFAEPTPPVYEVEKQADYWWNLYLKRHESKPGLNRRNFIDCVEELSRANN